jgi:hypothetical protein
MTSKSRIIISEALAEELDTEDLVREREKTSLREARKAINEELEERYMCPKCDNELMYNSKEDKTYCPTGDWERDGGLR